MDVSMFKARDLRAIKTYFMHAANNGIFVPDELSSPVDYQLSRLSNSGCSKSSDKRENRKKNKVIICPECGSDAESYGCKGAVCPKCYHRWIIKHVPVSGRFGRV